MSTHSNNGGYNNGEYNNEEYNNGDLQDDVDTIVNYLFERNIVRYRSHTAINLINESIINSIYELLSDYEYEYENVLQSSFNEQESLERKDDFINFIPVKYCNIKSTDYEIKCSICLINYEDEDDVSVTKCKHLFHNGHIIKKNVLYVEKR